eukprot:18576-Heterococcus_DN1.PRE.2
MQTAAAEAAAPSCAPLDAIAAVALLQLPPIQVQILYFSIIESTPEALHPPHTQLQMQKRYGI